MQMYALEEVKNHIPRSYFRLLVRPDRASHALAVLEQCEDRSLRMTYYSTEPDDAGRGDMSESSRGGSGDFEA
jgi:hypothetical protein